MKTILENEFVTINYDNNQALLTLQWTLNTSSMSPEKFQDLMFEIAHLIGELGAKFFLADSTNFDFVIIPEMQHWVSGGFNDRMGLTGLKKMALVLPQEVFAQVSIVQTIEEIADNDPTDNFEILHTDSLFKAKKWLMEAMEMQLS